MVKYACMIALFGGVILAHQPAGSEGKEHPAELKQHYRKDYIFTFDNTFYSFVENIPVWEKMLQPFKGKPDVHYLEIGVNQGRSALWVLENILTDPSSTLTGIDIFPKGTGIKEKYLSNLQLSGYEHKAATIEGFSQIELRKLPLNSFDIIYIDGDHTAGGVLADAVLSLPLLKTGGVIIFDDYRWRAGQLPDELRPQIAIDAFITAYRNSIELIHRDYQVFIKKREGFCERFPVPPAGCSPLGQYVYVWNWTGAHQLYRRDTGEPVTLSDKERGLIEKALISARFGEATLRLDSALSKDRDFMQLCGRLHLDCTNIGHGQER